MENKIYITIKEIFLIINDEMSTKRLFKYKQIENSKNLIILTLFNFSFFLIFYIIDFFHRKSFPSKKTSLNSKRDA